VLLAAKIGNRQQEKRAGVTKRVEADPKIFEWNCKKNCEHEKSGGDTH
jgi:hypothetical protein